MVANNRLKTGWETFFKSASVLYMLSAFPLALIMGLLMVFVAMPNILRDKDIGLMVLCALFWLGVLLPIAIIVFRTLRRRRQLRKIVTTLRHPQYFCPESHLEMFHEGEGKYLGIDVTHGTILYVHRIRQGTVDIVALTSKDWTNLEVQGKKLRINTRLVDLPRIEFATPWAERWYDTLGAMQYKEYSTPFPFTEFVESYTQQIERSNSVNVLSVA